MQRTDISDTDAGALLEKYTQKGQSLLDHATGDVRDHLGKLLATLPTIATTKRPQVLEGWLEGVCTEMDVKLKISHICDRIASTLFAARTTGSPHVEAKGLQAVQERFFTLRNAFTDKISDDTTNADPSLWSPEQLLKDLTDLEKEMSEILELDTIDQAIDMTKFSTVITPAELDQWNDPKQNNSAIDRIYILKKAKGLPGEIGEKIKTLQALYRDLVSQARTEAEAMTRRDGSWSGDDQDDLATAAGLVDQSSELAVIEKLELEILNECVRWINSLT